MTEQQYELQRPSERDLDIYAAVKIDCRRQVEVAEQFGVCQARVSQIVSGVRKWKERNAADDELAQRGTAFVERQLDARRLEWLYENAVQCYRRSCEPTRRERSGSSPRGDWTANTTMHAPGDTQCLKLAAKVIELRWKLADREPPSRPHDLMCSDLKTIQQWLASELDWAHVEGRVPRNGRNVYDEVRETLDKLLGLQAGMPISERTRPRLGRACADYEGGDRESGIGEATASEGARVTECAQVPQPSPPTPSHPHTLALVPATEPAGRTEATDTPDNISRDPRFDGHIEEDWPQDIKDYVLRGYKLAPKTAEDVADGLSVAEKAADISRESGDGGRESGDGGRESGDGGRESGDGGRESEVGESAGSSRQEEPPAELRPLVAPRPAGPAEPTQEQRLLREIERVTGREQLYPAMADLMYGNVLGRGVGEAILRGHSRELRDVLARWGKLMQRRKKGETRR